jgi:hypothetical protein
LQAAALFLQTQDDLFAKQKVTAIRNQIERMFTRPLLIERDTLGVVRTAAGVGKESVLLKLT